MSCDKTVFRRFKIEGNLFFDNVINSFLLHKLQNKYAGIYLQI